MKRPPQTPLQQGLVELRDALFGARDRLDDRAYLLFLRMAATILAREIARCCRWQLDDDDRGAA